jgi:GAF domain-containing protein
VAEERTQLVVDVSADPGFIALSQGVASELAVPLRVDGTVVGVLNIETTARLPDDAADMLRRPWPRSGVAARPS